VGYSNAETIRGKWLIDWPVDCGSFGMRNCTIVKALL
jgi:hypothetical protein